MAKTKLEEAQLALGAATDDVLSKAITHAWAAGYKPGKGEPVTVEVERFVALSTVSMLCSEAASVGMKEAARLLSQAHEIMLRDVHGGRLPCSNTWNGQKVGG